MANMTTDVEDLIPLPTFSHDWEKNKPYLFNDLGIVIEFLEGDTRSKTKGNGAIVSNIMPAAYGFILRTTDQHGEEIDVYIASMPDTDADIFVIDQVHPGDKLFDEHKVMLGFSSKEEALYIYNEVFSDGSGTVRAGAITTFPGKTFHQWIATEGYSQSPASKYTAADVIASELSGIGTPPKPPVMQPKPLDEAGGVIIELPDLSKGPKIRTKANEDKSLRYYLSLFSALDTKVWSNTVDTFCRTLDQATENDEVHITIASPGGSVFLMGRLVSAIKCTKAKVFTYAQGCVASAATTVWIAGHERHILPGAYFMQHMSSQILGGKSGDISAKSAFCVEYISRQLEPAVQMGLFTDQEVSDMITKSADIYISGREAIARVGAVSADVPAQ